MSDDSPSPLTQSTRGRVMTQKSLTGIIKADDCLGGNGDSKAKRSFARPAVNVAVPDYFSEAHTPPAAGASKEPRSDWQGKHPTKHIFKDVWNVGMLESGMLESKSSRAETCRVAEPHESRSWFPLYVGHVPHTRLSPPRRASILSRAPSSWHSLNPPSLGQSKPSSSPSQPNVSKQYDPFLDTHLDLTRPRLTSQRLTSIYAAIDRLEKQQLWVKIPNEIVRSRTNITEPQRKKQSSPSNWPLNATKSRHYPSSLALLEQSITTDRTTEASTSLPTTTTSSTFSKFSFLTEDPNIDTTSQYQPLTTKPPLNNNSHPTSHRNRSGASRRRAKQIKEGTAELPPRFGRRFTGRLEIISEEESKSPAGSGDCGGYEGDEESGS